MKSNTAHTKAQMKYLPWILEESCSRDPAAHRPQNTPGQFGPNHLNSGPGHWHPPLQQPARTHARTCVKWGHIITELSWFYLLKPTVRWRNQNMHHGIIKVAYKLLLEFREPHDVYCRCIVFVWLLSHVPVHICLEKSAAVSYCLLLYE